MESKKILSAIAELFHKEERHRMHSAILLAAGQGARFGDVKQLTMLGERPVLYYAAMAFERCDLIDEIVVVARAEDVDAVQMALADCKKRKCVIAGGATRQISAKIGFDAVSPEAEFVSIHDAARCLITPEIIERTAREAYVYGAAAAAEKPVDTIKRADDDGCIAETLDREKIWLVKTPQTFMADMYRAAAYMAERDGVTATDDCALVERLGFRVKLVDCGRENLKITYPEDLERAWQILQKREGMEKDADRTRV